MSRNTFQKSRIAVIIIVLSLILVVYASAMYEVQVIAPAENSGDVGTTTYSVVAANRGNILDRNGVLLVSSEAKYDVKIDRSAVLAQDNTNDIIYDLIRVAMATDTEYIDTFPVTMSGPFSFRANMSESDRNRLDYYLDYFGLDPDISASDLIVWMREHYKIDYLTSINDARLIIGVRYELEIRVIMNISEYIFAQNVDLDFITYVKEQNFPGVTVSTKWERVYNTKCASHLLGYVGLMDAEEYEVYKELGYPMDAVIGKDGVEGAFEEYLHGVDGRMATVTDADGNIIDTYMDKEVQSGGNVFLTIDIEMQKVAEEALAKTVAKLNADRRKNQELANGGAVVVKDVNSGEILTCASYPTYDLSTLADNYTRLANDQTRPLFNRATQGTYNPGSTFKMVTALAGLTKGEITRYTSVNATGRYTRYQGYQPVCWIYPSSHGTLDVVGAIAKSCNYYFYWLGDHIGIDVINQAAVNFGFGSRTGIEITESAGIVYSPDYKEETVGESWYAADTLISSIGQNDMITPIQLANYVSSIANNGTLYKTTLLGKVMNEDYTKTLVADEMSVLKMVEDKGGYLAVLRDGMEAVASTGGTAASMLADYPVKLAAKTGTVQSDAKSVNNGVFVCYAPADDPQIAIAVVVENGGSGSAIVSIAVELLDYYFSSDYTARVLLENTLG